MGPTPRPGPGLSPGRAEPPPKGGTTSSASDGATGSGAMGNAAARRAARRHRWTQCAPHTPCMRWDPMGPLSLEQQRESYNGPLSLGCGVAARGCRTRAGGAHPVGTPPAPPALTRRGSAVAAHTSAWGHLPVGPFRTVLWCACADRRPLLSRCSRATGAARCQSYAWRIHEIRVWPPPSSTGNGNVTEVTVM